MIEAEKEYPETVITAFLNYSKVQDIATATGLSTKTIQRYRKDPVLLHKIYERREMYIANAVSRMNEAMMKATEELLTMIEADGIKPEVKLKAIQILFDSCGRLEEMRDGMRKLAERYPATAEEAEKRRQQEEAEQAMFDRLMSR